MTSSQFANTNRPGSDESAAGTTRSAAAGTSRAPLGPLILGPENAVHQPGNATPQYPPVPADDADPAVLSVDSGAQLGTLVLGPYALDTPPKDKGALDEGSQKEGDVQPRRATSIEAVLDSVSMSNALLSAASATDVQPSQMSRHGPSRRRVRGTPYPSQTAAPLDPGALHNDQVLSDLPAAVTKTDLPPDYATDAVPAYSARQPLAVGIAALVLLFGGVGAWSVSTTLTGAVVASGMVEVESERQVIQHPDGGVVRAIHVREGDLVAPGDVLVELDGSRIASQLAIVEGQLGELFARRARLEAERDGAATISFPADLLALTAANPVVSDKLQGERALFTARAEAMELQTSLVAEQNRQIENRIKGIEAQLEAARTETGLLESQLEDQQGLLDRGLTPLGQVLELQRALAELKGRVGSFEAEIAGLRGEAAGNEITLLQAKTQRREDAVATLRDLEFSQIELAERRLELIETLSRLEIRAPGEGVVYDSQVFALQSVVQPGAPLMYIVPQEQPLVITARVASVNISEVYVGQEASLRFAAFDQQLVPELNATVQRISADVLRDENSGEIFYEVEILPAEGELAKLGEQTLVPGMPVDAFIRTRERSALTYLLEPFAVFFSRAFRE
jgi:HlyD family type I secretion membrane fusion protein